MPFDEAERAAALKRGQVLLEELLTRRAGDAEQQVLHLNESKTLLVVQDVVGDEPFDIFQLEWHQRKWTDAAGGQALEALIRTTDLPRFLNGERLRVGGGEGDGFLCHNQRENKGSCYSMHCCSHCPPRAAAASQPREEGKRGTGAKPSKKVGCSCRFATVTYTAGDRNGCTLLRLLDWEHSLACSVIKPRILTRACVDRVKEWIRTAPELSSALIVQRNADWIINAEAVKSKESVEAVLARFNQHPNLAPSDYHLNTRDVLNIRVEYDSGVWRLSEDVRASLRLGLKEHEGDVFFFQDQTRRADDPEKADQPFVLGLCPADTLRLAMAQIPDGHLHLDGSFGMQNPSFAHISLTPCPFRPSLCHRLQQPAVSRLHAHGARRA